MDFEIRLDKTDSVITPEANMPTRDQFGPGNLGDYVFRVVSAGNLCEECGKPATRSVDHSRDVVLVCGSKCAEAVSRSLLGEANAINRFLIITENGFGRA